MCKKQHVELEEILIIDQALTLELNKCFFFHFPLMKNTETENWKTAQTIVFASAPLSHILETINNQLPFCDNVLIVLVCKNILICLPEL